MAVLILRELGMDRARADASVKGLRRKALRVPTHIDDLAVRDGRNREQEQSQ